VNNFHGQRDQRRKGESQQGTSDRGPLGGRRRKRRERRTKARTAIDDVIAAIESARDKVMADEVKALTKLGIPRAMAYQMVAARFHQNVVTDGEGGGPEFENSHWNDR